MREHFSSYDPLEGQLTVFWRGFIRTGEHPTGGKFALQTGGDVVCKEGKGVETYQWVVQYGEGFIPYTVDLNLVVYSLKGTTVGHVHTGRDHFHV